MFDPYYDFTRNWRFKPAKPVRHQQTCPVCGRKLVNTYLRDGVWKCRRCWEGDRHESISNERCLSPRCSGEV